jgi:hypothetical protein
MTRAVRHSLGLTALGVLVTACGSDPVRKQPTASNEMPPPASAELKFDVSATRPTYLRLSTPAVVEVTDPKHSSDWDLAFVGFDVLTNGGISGAGGGKAFGPLDISYFAFPEEPVDVPFLIADAAGGVFLRWYAYDGSNHTLYSRYHVYGLRSGETLYKLQVLGYYGDVQGAPVSAFYQLRYAEVAAGGAETREIHDLDATLDGDTADADVAGGCLTLATGNVARLTPSEAAEALDWDICFRREGISVNGELGGPGEVSGVDLQASETNDEPLALVKKRTASSERPAFDAADEAALTAPGLAYRGDYVTSAFTGKWADARLTPPVPTPSTAFLVVGADGQSRFLVVARSFEGPSATTPGTVTLGIQPTASP